MIVPLILTGIKVYIAILLKNKEKKYLIHGSAREKQILGSVTLKD